MALLRHLAAPLTAVGSALVNAVATMCANAAARRLEDDRLRAVTKELQREKALLREEIRIKTAVLEHLSHEEPPH